MKPVESVQYESMANDSVVFARSFESLLILNTNVKDAKKKIIKYGKSRFKTR